MREFLFRGKSVNSGEWVEGSLVITTIEPAEDTPIKHYHIEGMTIGVFPNEFQSGFDETVDPETVGQFTGLTDKNGKKIFEGDVLCRDNVNGYVLYSTEFCKFVFCWKKYDKYRPDHFKECGLTDYARFHDLEVIGNIHDNPELLEG